MPNFSKPAKEGTFVVLMLGETGSGKSTLINYATSYFRGGTLARPRIAILTPFYAATEEFPHTEKDMDKPWKSKTCKCTNYDFESNGRPFRFIDSPGLSDTGGDNKDDEHIDEIYQAAEGAGTLSGIVLVINGTATRLSSTLRTTLLRLRAIMPDVLVDNLIVVLTFCSPADYTFDLRLLFPWKIKNENIFFMNNAALARDPRCWQNDKSARKDMEKKWKKSLYEVDRMVERITNLDAASTRVFTDMRQHRNQLKQELHRIMLEIKKLQMTQDDLEEAQSIYHGATKDIEKYRNFVRKREVTYPEIVSADYHSTVCMVHSDFVCHDNCSLEYHPQTNVPLFTKCACMKDGICTDCGCGTTQHYHAKVTLGQRKETVEDILHDVKAKYMSATQRADSGKNSTSKLQADFNVLEHALHDTHSRVEQCCKELKKICSAFNFADEMNSVLQAMRANARTLTSINAREKANEMIREIKQLVDQLQQNGQDPDGQMHDQHYKDPASSMPQMSRPNFQQEDETDSDEDSGSGSGARGKTYSDASKRSDTNPSNQKGNRADASKLPKDKKEETCHPCPEFNRGQPCKRRPCSFAHQCLLCDELHGAFACCNRGSSPETAVQKEDVLQNEATTTAHLQMMEQMQMQMKMLQQMQMQMMQTSMQGAGNAAMPAPGINSPGNVEPSGGGIEARPGNSGNGRVDTKRPGMSAASAALVTVGRLAQKKLDKILKPYTPQ